MEPTSRLARSSVIAILVLWSLAPRPTRAWQPEPTDAAAGIDKQEAPQQDVHPATLADARELFMRGEYEKSIDAYAALTQSPETATGAIVGLARCRLQVGKYDEAIDWLLGHAHDDSADWHFVLAQAHNHVGRYDDVLTHCAKAAELDPDHAGARRLRAETLERLGRRDEAIEAYQWFEQQLVQRGELKGDAAWITDTAVGFVRYTVLSRGNLADRLRHVLRNMLQQAYERVDRTYWPARVAAADLLRERFNNDEQDGSVSDYQAALRINPHLPQAEVGLGLVALENWGFEEIEKRTANALDVNPNYAPTLHLLARKLIVERRYAEAIEACERALGINGADIEALSLAASAAAVMQDTKRERKYERRVTKIDPRCAALQRAIGDALGGVRQYEASEAAYLKAIEYDPTNANARTDLGMMYMQWGLEDKARDALEAAWALDPFNERTKFTLELLEMIERFDRYETDHFVVRWDATQDPGLGPYIGDYLEPLYGEVTADFDTPLEHKTEIEIFPTQRAFAVRITGKPWIHTVGACTGRVIAMASPRESPQLMGPFDLASVLRHEFTHTVTLAATNNRIPHWFTEGLAVYQEDSPRAFEWCELLADAIRHDELFTLESIDWGFIRPKRPTDRQMAYAQSEWMVEYIVARFGYDTIQRLLDGYKGGETQTEMLRALLNVEPADFDHDFAVWARAQAAPWGLELSKPEDVATVQAEADATPDDAAVLGRLAKARLDARDADKALETAKRTLALDENNRDALNVLVTVLYAYSRQERDARARDAYDDQALPAIERLVALDPDGWIAPKYLGEITLRRKQLDRAIEALQRLQRNLPIDPASWRGLAGVYLERGDDSLALPQLVELARLVNDDADVRAKIARFHRKQGRLREAIYWFGRALFISPFDVDLHQSLGDTCMQASATPCALREYEMLTRIEPKVAAHFASAALAAKKLGRDEQAVEFARQAVALDPSSHVRSLLP